MTEFLIDRSDFREPIRFEIIPAGSEKLAQVLQKLAEEPAPDVPVAAVVADFEFGASGPEMEGPPRPPPSSRLRSLRA